MKVVSTSCTDIGTRDYYEDRLVIQELTDGWLLAVMDGHGGAEAATFIADNLVQIFSETAEEPSFVPSKLAVVFRKLHLGTKHMHPGSVLSLVFLPRNVAKAYVAVLGDVPVVIKGSGGKIFTGPEHNARSNPKERAAAEARGAVYSGGYLYEKYTQAGLQFARALGDRECDSFLNREPEICTVDLGDEGFILVGSDGLFDPGHHDTAVQVGRLVKMIEKGADAKALVEDALSRGTEDNVTAILCRYTNHPQG